MTDRAATAWAVIPVKAFTHAKSRLVSLAPARRQSLARSFFDHVLHTALAVPGLAGVAVITSSPDVAARARRKGATVWPDAPVAGVAGETAPGTGDIGLGAADTAGQGRAVAAAIERLRAIGAGAALVLMSDLPGLRAADVTALVTLLGTHDVVVAPDRHDEGTNALALAPPHCMPTSFGRADSFARHCAAARGHRLRLAVYRSHALALDVDSPTDLAAWRAAQNSHCQSASRSSVSDSSRASTGRGSIALPSMRTSK